MNQNERWLTKYNEIMDFMAENHRRPSKYNPEERNNWKLVEAYSKAIERGNIETRTSDTFSKAVGIRG